MRVMSDDLGMIAGVEHGARARDGLDLDEGETAVFASPDVDEASSQGVRDGGRERRAHFGCQLMREPSNFLVLDTEHSHFRHSNENG